MQNTLPVSISLFERFTRELSGRIRPLRCTKATLVHISHTLEDVVLRHRLPAMVFTGFQESSHWREETRRYTALSQVARQVCIFAGKPLPLESMASQIHVPLEGDDPLRQEWFLCILSDRFSVLLCGQDRHLAVKDEALRQFDTLWSFDPAIINSTLDILDAAVAVYRPDRVNDLRAARADYPPLHSDAGLLTEVMSEMINFEEGLNRRLAGSEERYRLVAETASDVILTLDASGVVRYANAAAERVFGYPVTRLVGEPGSRLFADPQPNLLGALRLPQSRQSLEAEGVRPDGRRIPLEITLVGYEHAGEPVVTCIARDITERKQTERALLDRERLQVSLEKERELSDMRNRTLTTLAHEFRTPLAIILSSSELLERYSQRMSTERRAGAFEQIRRQIAYLSNMLSAITELMRAQGAATALHVDWLDLDGTARWLAAEAVRSQGDSHKVFVSVDPPTLRVLTDVHLIRHIILNLLVNAIQYSPDRGSVWLTVEQQGQTVRIEVRDQGLGIPPADQAHVFEPFFRASNAGFTPGAGLGLKLVRDSVDLLGGTVALSSTEGVGTTVTVTLPLRHASSQSPSSPA